MTAPSRLALVLLFASALRRLRPPDLGFLDLRLDLASRLPRDRCDVMRMLEPRLPRRRLRGLGVADGLEALEEELDGLVELARVVLRQLREPRLDRGGRVPDRYRAVSVRSGP